MARIAFLGCSKIACDLTGNTRIVLAEPGLFIETQGASEAPTAKSDLLVGCVGRRPVVSFGLSSSALLVAKVHEIDDRSGSDRASDKDALDVLPPLRGTETEDLAAWMVCGAPLKTACSYARTRSRS